LSEASDLVQSVFGIDFTLLLFTIALIASSAVTTLLRSRVIAFRKTKTLPFIMLVSVILKVILAIALILSGTGVLGLLAASIDTLWLASVIKFH
jgi:hypothetical protein